jgi:hypothetical protein
MRGCGGRHAAALGGCRAPSAACGRVGPTGSAGLHGEACSASGRLLTAGPLLPCLPAAVGIEADSERVSKLLSELEGKDIAEVGPPAARRGALPPARLPCLPLQRGRALGGSTAPLLRGHLYAASAGSISASQGNCRQLPAASSA